MMSLYQIPRNFLPNVVKLLNQSLNYELADSAVKRFDHFFWLNFLCLEHLNVYLNASI